MKIINKETKKVYDTILTNQSMTIEEAISLLGIDEDEQEKMEKMSSQYDFIYQDDNRNWCVDYDIIEMEY